MLKKMRIFFFLGVCFSATGCASWFGNADYGCSGIPDRPKCMSARDSYLRNGGDDNAAPASSGAEVASSGSDDEIVKVRHTVDQIVLPKMPNKPQPIRTPAKVMRILVAPYEDVNDDLVVSSYVFTEIEKRKWLYENSAVPEYSGIKPLQTLPPIDHNPENESKEPDLAKTQQSVNEVLQSTKALLNKKK